MFDDSFLLLLGALGLFYLIGLPILVFVLFARLRRLERSLSASAPQTQPQPAQPEPAESPAARIVEERKAQKAAADAATETKIKSPWPTPKKPAPAIPSTPPTPPKTTPSSAARLLSWLTGHWVYVVSALSLALAGVFLVQYGVENGLLPPAARVAAALLFGGALIGGGEWIQRKSGDEGETASAYLPSVFSGAGLVSLFGGVMAARVLYGLIGANLAFGGFVAVTGLALFMGWRYGPFLAAIGLIGGYAAPFVLGGDSSGQEMLLAYFALLAALGLGIDTLRRWAWVSVLTLVLGFLSAFVLWLAVPTIAPWLLLYAAALTVLAVLVPARSLWPDQSGRTILYSLLARRKPGQPIFPVWLSAATLLAATALILFVATVRGDLFWHSFALLCALTATFALWSKRATGLQDQTLIPLIGALVTIGLNDIHRDTRTGFSAERLPEASWPLDTFWILAIAAAVTLVLAWRSGQSRLFRPLWAAAAVTFLPAAGLLLEYQWTPALVLGAYPWALQALAVAALLVLLAERFARADGAERTRVALATMAALATLGFAFSVIFTTAALTVALALVVLSAAALDRQFNLPLLEWFIMAGVAAVTYRLIVDPGLLWAREAALPEVLAAQAISLAATCASLWLQHQQPRPRANAALESGAWVFGGILLSTLLYRAIAYAAPGSDALTHWSAGLYATIWISLAFAQIHRMGSFKALRITLASAFGLVATGWIIASLTIVNPLIAYEKTFGPLLINSFIPGYLFPAAALALGVWKLAALPPKLRRALAAAAGALGTFWATLALRAAWHPPGSVHLSRGFPQPELYSYTLALLIIGAAIFYQSLARHSALLRRLGLGVIALAIAKVFLVDISGLTGLIRVFSLLGLGLMLAAMAWVDRWARNKSSGN